VNGGVPGVASNVPPGQAQEPAQTSSTNTANKNEVINYEISRTVAKIIEPTGTIKQLSVAVLVDGTYEPVKEGSAADAVRKYVPRPEAEMKQIEEIVKKAMGYSADRQDQVEVVNVQFGFEGDVGAGSATAAEEAPSLLKTYAPYIRYGVGAALFLLILVFVVRPLVTALTAPSAASSMQDRMGGSSATVLSQGETPSLQQSQVLDLARNNPESTAVVVKQWLKAT